MNKIGNARFKFMWDRHSYTDNDGMPVISDRKPWEFKFDFDWGNENCFLGIWLIFATPIFVGGIYT